MKKLKIVFCLLVILAASSMQAPAWSNPGHMLVALIAYKQLTPATRARVDELVALNPKIDEWRGKIPPGTSPADTKMMLFIIAATWPDQIKSDPEYDNPDGPDGGNTPPPGPQARQNIGYSDKFRHKYWHFVDLPFSTDGTPVNPPNVPNADTQIKTFIMVLASSANDELKSYDLVWLLHVVGDVHQPLHATARFTNTQKKGDDGGNGVGICDPQCGHKLHGFWDGIFGSTNDLRASVKLAIKAAKGIPPAPKAAAENQSVSAWIDESFNIAKTVVYKNPPIGNGKGPFTITAAYRNKAIEIANKRVAVGGARLANVLNRNLQ